MISVPRPVVSGMPCTMYCDNGNMGALSFTSATFTISCQTPLSPYKHGPPKHERGSVVPNSFLSGSRNIVWPHFSCAQKVLSCSSLRLLYRGVARNLLTGRQKRGSEGRKTPSGVQGQSPGKGLGACPRSRRQMLRIRLNKIHKNLKKFPATTGGGTRIHAPLGYPLLLYCRVC